MALTTSFVVSVGGFAGFTAWLIRAAEGPQHGSKR